MNFLKIFLIWCHYNPDMNSKFSCLKVKSRFSLCQQSLDFVQMCRAYDIMMASWNKIKTKQRGSKRGDFKRIMSQVTLTQILQIWCHFVVSPFFSLCWSIYLLSLCFNYLRGRRFRLLFTFRTLIKKKYLRVNENKCLVRVHLKKMLHEYNVNIVLSLFLYRLAF